MGKIRINKLALELNIPNDKIIDELKKRDYPVKNHMSSIDGETAELIRDLFTDKPTAKAKAKSKSKAPAKKVSTVVMPITAKTAAKAAALKKVAQEKTDKLAAKEGAKAKTTAKVATPPPAVAAKTEKTEADKHKAPRKLGLKVTTKEEEEKKKLSMQILQVEDDSETAKAVELMLQSDGHSCETTTYAKTRCAWHKRTPTT